MKPIVHPPEFIRTQLKDVIWNIPGAEKRLFLTFDDGPVPDVTPWVLDTLISFSAKATFFCLGRNVERNPEIFERILQEGHKTGNHSYSHVKGLFKDDEHFLKDIDLAQQFINSDFFRPPHGRIKKKQVQTLKSKYKIILWDVLSQDYETKLSPEKCWQNVLQYTKSGSIIVFHDSQKAAPRMKYSLEKTLTHFSGLGFKFESLP